MSNYTPGVGEAASRLTIEDSRGQRFELNDKEKTDWQYYPVIGAGRAQLLTATLPRHDTYVQTLERIGDVGNNTGVASRFNARPKAPQGYTTNSTVSGFIKTFNERRPSNPSASNAMVMKITPTHRPGYTFAVSTGVSLRRVFTSRLRMDYVFQGNHPDFSSVPGSDTFPATVQNITTYPGEVITGRWPTKAGLSAKVIGVPIESSLRRTKDALDAWRPNIHSGKSSDCISLPMQVNRRALDPSGTRRVEYLDNVWVSCEISYANVSDTEHLGFLGPPVMPPN